MSGYSIKNLSKLCAGLMMLGAGAAASALPVQDAAPEAIAGAKRNALAVLRMQARPATTGDIAIDIGNREPSLLLDEAELVVDREPLLNYRYGASGAQSLHRGALSRLAAYPLAAGKHHLRLKLAARYADSPPDRTRAVVAFERDVLINSQTTSLQFELLKSSVLGQPDVELHQLAAATDAAASMLDRYVIGSDADPQLREASYLVAAGRPLAALQALYALEAGAGPYAASAELQAHIGEAARAFGLEAAAATADLPAAAEPAVSEFNRANALLRDGHIAEASAALEALATAKSDSDAQALLRDRANLVLGYTLLRNHAGASAAPAFGRVRSTGPCTNAALLGLGWSMLAPSGNGATSLASTQPRLIAAAASAPLPRIPTLLQPALTTDIAALKLHEPYALKEALANEERAVRRALVPWTELTGRDPLDPAVQEGAVAIPYVMNHIGAHPEAIDYYRRALYLLEAVDSTLDRAISQIGSGKLRARLAMPAAENQGWPWWISAMPPQHWWLANDPRDAMAAPEGFYLPHLMVEPAFRSAMEDWHDLGQLDAALAALGEAPEVLTARAGLAPTLRAQERTLDELAAANLRRTKRQTEMYLGEARFAFGRINEEQVKEARK